MLQIVYSKVQKESQLFIGSSSLLVRLSSFKFTSFKLSESKSLII